MAVEMKYGDYLKGGWELVKPNLVPSIVAMLVGGVPILGIQVQINYLKAIKEAKNSGKAIEIGALFDFANLVNNVVACFIMGVGFMCCLVPGAVLFMTPAILADHPGTGFMDAVKGAMAFGKQNIVPMIILVVIFSVLINVSAMVCVLPVFVVGPTVLAGYWLCYEDHKAAVHAAAAEAGITLT